MEINTIKKGNVLVILLKGRLDALTAPDFDKKIESLLSEGENAFIINFSDLEYISSAGLRSILAIAKQLKAKDGKIMLAELKGAVKEVFEISGFYSIFQIFDSEADALNKMT
jgi:anti-anti-sigma factor